MSHKLDFIKREFILKALQKIDNEGIPKDHEWSEYWINHNKRLYQFKYVVELASSFTKTPLETKKFRSNHSSRKNIAALDFHILFKSHEVKNIQTNYWVGGSHFGLRGNQTDMFGDFIKNKYWKTDHYLENGEGLKVYNELLKVQINDRICIRHLDKKGGNVNISAIGTVRENSNIHDGILNIIWDYNPPLYKGQKPSGRSSGNWWKTIIQLKRQSDISLIFKETLIEKRVARLAWNDNGYVMPSGSYGKSEYEDSHEAKYGYGHEEWLFDTSKLIKGFHYGFLEPIRKHQNAYSDNIYSVWLYSINGETRRRFWIGEIENLIAINRDEANIVKQKYIDNGWLEEMEDQIRASGAKEQGFSNWNGVDLFNVKFMPNDIFLSDPYYELLNTHPINEQSRYSFAHFRDEFELTAEYPDDSFGYTYSPDKDDDDDPKREIHHRQPKAVEILYLHRAISNSLTKALRNEFGIENVTKEHPAGYGANKIDIVVNHISSMTFYEIKTYNSLKTSIREAFGQLMEYCFYPDKRKANELIIVTQLPADIKTKTYFQHLRDIFKLPIYYQSYDLDTRTLSEKC